MPNVTCKYLVGLVLSTGGSRLPGFDVIRIGDKATVSKTITHADIQRFAEVTGDTNPVHLDETYAKMTVFRGRAAHGMLTASLISTVLGTKLPGAGNHTSPAEPALPRSCASG